MVREGGVEPPTLSGPAPKAGASACSATLAFPATRQILGGPCRGRTCGPLIKSQLLYQLS
jgi:hypothetical protein